MNACPSNEGQAFFLCDDLIDAGHPLLLSNDRFGENGLVTISLRAAISPFLESAYGFGPGRTCCVIGCPPQGSHPWGMQQGSQAASCGIVIITGGSGFFVQGVRGEPWLHQFLSVPHPLAPITKKEVSAVRIRNFFIIITPWNVVGSSGGEGGAYMFSAKVCPTAGLLQVDPAFVPVERLQFLPAWFDALMKS